MVATLDLGWMASSAVLVFVGYMFCRKFVVPAFYFAGMLKTVGIIGMNQTILFLTTCISVSSWFTAAVTGVILSDRLLL